ncbi:MAG: LptF/LptG family permease [Verrucomicrobia bacterium]|nr:LptF/LptG family permease [Verrucomicrobiota bacterium]MBU6446342.1 LptF/LptG family permease [Verrucomicrobiota bacterium]MDE3048119.1 LptF/LptG family permease [Verrucomicrobiota bacterium]
MSILWRYALHSYARVFLLSVSTFIAVLMIARFKEIARFTALSGDFSMTGLFILYQIPTILPIAIPISTLIASLLLFQRMSRSFELTALRAAGMSLTKIVTPPLFVSIFLALLNFTLCAEIAPFCRRASKTLLYHETTSNPLLLLQRQKLVKLKNAFLDMDVKDDETIKDMTLIVPNVGTNRLSLISARKLLLEENTLIGKELALISYLPTESGFDPLMIENQQLMSTSAPLLSKALKRNRSRLDVNVLSFKMLRLYSKVQQAHIECLRRMTLSLAVFSFTFLGCAFGIEEGRTPSKKNLFFALLLTLSVLMSYLMGKGLKNSVVLSVTAFLLPHPFIWVCSSLHLYRIARGRT